MTVMLEFGMSDDLDNFRFILKSGEEALHFTGVAGKLGDWLPVMMSETPMWGTAKSGNIFAYLCRGEEEFTIALRNQETGKIIEGEFSLSEISLIVDSIRGSIGADMIQVILAKVALSRHLDVMPGLRNVFEQMLMRAILDKWEFSVEYLCGIMPLVPREDLEIVSKALSVCRETAIKTLQARENAQ